MSLEFEEKVFDVLSKYLNVRIVESYPFGDKKRITIKLLLAEKEISQDFVEFDIEEDFSF